MQIFTQSEIPAIERELELLRSVSERKNPTLESIAKTLEKSKLFHLRSNIARAKRQNDRALAANEISQQTWFAVLQALDRILAKGLNQ